MSERALLQVREVVKHFQARKRLFGRAPAAVRAVDGVSFDISEGEVFAVVGESGSGKTTLARCVLRLEEPTSGTIFFDNEDWLALQGRQLRSARRDMQAVFQDPYSSLNPRMSAGASIEEPLLVHKLGGRKERRERVAELLRQVGLAPSDAERYPHEFSGGQRQRICIARALALSPKLIVLDEPVSALDVSVQAQVVNLLRDLRDELGLSYLFIAHGLPVVENISDRVAVMYLGRFCETAATGELFARPLHPYTKALFAAVPEPDPDAPRAKAPIAGEIPSPTAVPSGCRFNPRCPMAQERCAAEPPELREIAPGHHVACHFA
ncbi:MAG: ATP-binding cassette domain-containing protein [Acidobacteria bacterium]|jgi:oligopeptide/dipeptide ABC transporter ATP-binding protein|nr:ATP-binding cassette domain-containing protein [Acidobacteriota bacterium]